MPSRRATRTPRPTRSTRCSFCWWSAPSSLDGVALAAIAGRISEFGFKPEPGGGAGREPDPAGQPGVVAWLYARFLRGRGSFSALERWQTDYLPIYAVWAGLVVVAFPPLFGFL